MQKGLLCLLTALTCIFILSEFLFIGINYHVIGVDKLFYSEFKLQLSFLKPHLQLSSIAIILPLIQFILSQLLTYVIYIYVLWYVTIAIGEFFSLPWNYVRYLSILLWLVSITVILAANTYYLPHSFFSILIRRDLFLNKITDWQLKHTLIITFLIFIFAVSITFFAMCSSFLKKKNSIRHTIMVAFILLVLLVTYVHPSWQPSLHFSVATEKKPNIFIIGFDALRPDYLSYFNNKRNPTPQFDNFLKSSIVFTNAYTPVARTFPSWISILTAKYPLHTLAREDNIDLALVKHDLTLSKILQKAGYDTLYASDDNRFNNINNKEFNFDHFIGPSGSISDIIVSDWNDFPISNLLITTPVGKWLFPYNFANHASAHTYEPDNFMQLLSEALQKPQDKPIFLAVHFNFSGWPFYFFNDGQPYDASSVALYKNVVRASDQQLEKFLGLLKKNGLLNHAIFVLISDHGVSLKLPGDRVTTESLYQGNIADIKVKRTRYGNIRFSVGKNINQHDDEIKFISLGDASLAKDSKKFLLALAKAISPLNPALSGIDTSWGYGSDVLSLKQNHSLLAFRAYGVTFGEPHSISARALLLDIAPTLLDFLNISSPMHGDGFSLKSYLLDPEFNLSYQRPIYLETSFTIPELERENILVNAVLAKAISLYQINPVNGLISILPATEKKIIKEKQRAILLSDWLLAYYPASRENRIVYDKQGHAQPDLQEYIQQPYAVLVNLKTGKWTTNMQDAFSATAPLKLLTKQLHEFYGPEMRNYRT